MKISVARAADAGPIARMSRILIEHDLPWSWTEQRVQRSIRHSETAVIVARDRHRLAGFAIMRFGDSDAHLDLFAVAPAWRRRGVGRSLLAWLEACARTAGIFDIRLELRSDNDVARSFYAVQGYVDCGLAPGYYAGREDALRMRRDLRLTHGHV
jgi:ribosomal-protein-alanine N-acetyltransferase